MAARQGIAQLVGRFGRYAWSAKLPLSILTDFEEFAVYDCRIRPRPGDQPSAARTMYLTYDQYADRWDEVASIFSKQAVLEGSFDKYVTGSRKRGAAEVDAEFLKEIERWREALARNLAPRNAGLGVREINFAVQRTIDRIIFLRIGEDRGVEPYGALQALLNGPDTYGRLMQRFRNAEAYRAGRYNEAHLRRATRYPLIWNGKPNGSAKFWFAAGESLASSEGPSLEWRRRR